MSTANETRELRELYQEVILDHSRHPRNTGALAGAQYTATGYNPLCGDRITLHVKMRGDRIGEVRFEGKGCAISTAAASTLTEVVRGMTLAEVNEAFERFHDVITGAAPREDLEPYGKLVAFAGVAEFPMRVKCATLPWHAIHNALQGSAETAKTE